MDRVPWSHWALNSTGSGVGRITVCHEHAAILVESQLANKLSAVMCDPPHCC